jgi:hypothetical protein
MKEKTPKEEAKELVDSFIPHVKWKMGQEDCLDRAKQCALITCNKVLGYMGADRGYSYWQSVKTEIEKL